ncbi:hypothetical protein C0992_006761, partial [Termitomyces sp. T32_za158]
MDGNDSLKRVIHRDLATKDENGELTPGMSKELQDNCKVVGDYYLSRDSVDQWAKGVLQEMLLTGKDLEEGAAGSESNPCGKQWKNMINELMAHIWGIFDETGIFLSLCRHSFVLLIANTVQSVTFLISNYKQALQLINSLPALEKQMKDQGVENFEMFKQWLVEEKAYLEALSCEPVQETLQMEYYQKLVNLEDSQKALDEAQLKWLVIMLETHNAHDYTRSTETECQHALKNHEKDLKIIQGLELKLGITTRWTQTCP